MAITTPPGGYTPGEIRRGNVPYMLFHYIGMDTIASGIVTSLSIARAQCIKDPAMRRLTHDRVMSVLIASQAINRMMGNSPTDGMFGGSDEY